VGIVADNRQLLADNPRPKIFTPFLQIPQDYEDLLSRPVTIFVRTIGDSTTAEPAVRRAIAELDPTLAGETQTIGEIVSESLLQPRFRTLILGVLGATAFFLSIIGLYGVLASAAARETRETGIRIALGATPGSVLLSVIRRGMLITGVGIAFGLLVSFIFMRLIQNFLFGVRITDPVAALLAMGALLLASLLATFIPGCRATSVNPVIALRCE